MVKVTVNTNIKEQLPRNGSSNVMNSFAWMKDGKSLSKNLLYTPLKDYQDRRRQHEQQQQQQHHHESVFVSATTTTTTTTSTDAAAMTNTSSTSSTSSSGNYGPFNVPKELQEPTFVEFMQFVSHDYHRNNPRFISNDTTTTTKKRFDAMNNGSKPLTIQEMDNRIKSRAVTLMGGGISKNNLKHNHFVQGAGGRRRHRRRSRHRNAATMTTTMTTTPTPNTLEFLKSLNELWNKYIRKLVVPGTLSTTIDVRTNKKFEMVGALVKIEECKSRVQWVGSHGVIVDETKNTIRLAALSTSTKAQQLCILVVPKNHTKVSILRDATIFAA